MTEVINTVHSFCHRFSGSFRDRNRLDTKLGRQGSKHISQTVMQHFICCLKQWVFQSLKIVFESKAPSEKSVFLSEINACGLNLRSCACAFLFVLLKPARPSWL
jgi:hypothetical protein